MRSMTTPYTRAYRMPRIIPSVSVTGICRRNMAISMPDITVASFHPSLRFIIIAGTSMPPVEPPSLSTSPRPTPSSTPAHMAASRGSFTRWCSEVICSKMPMKSGNAKVPSAIVAAKRLPSTSAPVMNRTMLKAATTALTLAPVSMFTILPMPLIPLTTMSYGRAKHVTEKAQMAFPSTICANSNAFFLVSKFFTFFSAPYDGCFILELFLFSLTLVFGHFL